MGRPKKSLDNYKFDTSKYVKLPKKDKLVIITGIHCQDCGDVIVSLFRHDFNTCKCYSVYIDGGQDYTKVSFSVTSIASYKMASIKVKAPVKVSSREAYIAKLKKKFKIKK